MPISRCPECGTPLTQDEARGSMCPSCGVSLTGVADRERPWRDDRDERDDRFEERDFRDRPKERHGCLTAWLVLILIGNSFAVVATPLMVDQIRKEIPDFPDWVVWPLSVLGLLNIIFAIALFNWKKWGFFGFVATTIAAFALNIAAGMGPQSATGLIGIAILYGVLQIGGHKSGWSQLE